MVITVILENIMIFLSWQNAINCSLVLIVLLKLLLIEFRSIVPRTEETKTKKNLNLYNKLLAIYFKEYNSVVDYENKIG